MKKMAFIKVTVIDDNFDKPKTFTFAPYISEDGKLDFFTSDVLIEAMKRRNKITIESVNSNRIHINQKRLSL